MRVLQNPNRPNFKQTKKPVRLTTELHAFNPLINPQYQHTNSPTLSRYVSYGSSEEKSLKYQDNSSWVIMSLILMTSLID